MGSRAKQQRKWIQWLPLPKIQTHTFHTGVEKEERKADWKYWKIYQIHKSAEVKSSTKKRQNKMSCDGQTREGISVTSASVWEPRGCSRKDFGLIMMWMDSESQEVEEAGSFIKHCLHNVASRGASRVFTNHAAGWGVQGSVLSRGKAARYCSDWQTTSTTGSPQSLPFAPHQLQSEVANNAQRRTSAGGV